MERYSSVHRSGTLIYRNWIASGGENMKYLSTEPRRRGRKRGLGGTCVLILFNPLKPDRERERETRKWGEG
jgi:hypothetical protein